MVLYRKRESMQWNLEKIRFLYPPDDFVGGFANEKMQNRLKAMQETKINELLSRLEKQDDPFAAMCVLNRRDHIQFLQNNIEKFRRAGRLEETILHLYYRDNTPFSAGGDMAIWNHLFLACDRQRLADEGKPFPFASATGYRGSVVGNARGLSWTLDQNKAKWFLQRWEDKSLGGGTVFALDISADDILVYLEDEEKQEVILLPELLDSIQPREITSLD